ncbi:MAG: eCIS core domain-containing protein, partial [Anaerolineae bacterium]
MNGEREWLRIFRPRPSTQPETGGAERAPQAAKERAAGVAGARPIQRLSDVARRAGNQIAQRYAQEEAFVAPEHVERSIDAQAGGGVPLDHATRNQMEGAFGSDLSSVRVHNDAQADSLNADLSARAFTRGTDIFFASGEYAPGTGSGQRLLAHELAHVEQQQDGPKLDVGSASDPAELEADAVADQVVQRIAAGSSREAAAMAQAQRQVEEEEEESAQLVRRQEDEEDE